MPERDANIERLFNLVIDTNTNTANIRKDLGVLTAKVDDFSARLKKLEERDEKHVEREEELKLLAQRLESVLKGNEISLGDIDARVTELETDVTKIKSNWGWFVTILGSVGGIIGYLINLMVSIFRS